MCITPFQNIYVLDHSLWEGVGWPLEGVVWPCTKAQGKDIISFAGGGTEYRIGLRSSHTSLECSARPLGVSGAGRNFLRNLHVKVSDCLDRLAPNISPLF